MLRYNAWFPFVEVCLIRNEYSAAMFFFLRCFLATLGFLHTAEDAEGVLLGTRFDEGRSRDAIDEECLFFDELEQMGARVAADEVSSSLMKQKAIKT